MENAWILPENEPNVFNFKLELLGSKGSLYVNTSDHRILLPAVVLVGAILALVSDLIARMPGSQHALPLNAVTALLGAPVVTWVILRRRNLRSSFAS